MTNLLKSDWNDVDPGELRFVLYEVIGRPGQYFNRRTDPRSFFLPLADATCRVILRFSEENQLVAIERGLAFDKAQWQEVVDEIETVEPVKVGRECSFSSFRVTGSWTGKTSGVQILPPPADAPVAPFEIAEHPFILEFPLKTSARWPITNYRRIRDHRRLTLLLNIVLGGRTCVQPRRPRHLWAIDTQDSTGVARWVQEFYFARIGEAVSDAISPTSSPPCKEVPASDYYTNVGHDGRSLEVPSDLDEVILSYMRLSANNRRIFDRASYWMDMAARQWNTSQSASFASLVIAIEALGDRSKKPTKRFRDYLEQYAPGASLKEMRNQMYALRSDIVHGSGLMEVDSDDCYGWSPPEQDARDILGDLWALAKMSIRNWIRNPPPG